MPAFGEMENFTIDQFAGSLALILGSIGGLLMIIWKSRCECDLNCCYVWRCHRSPPKDEAASEDDDEKQPVALPPRPEVREAAQ